MKLVAFIGAFLLLVILLIIKDDLGITRDVKPSLLSSVKVLVPIPESIKGKYVRDFSIKGDWKLAEAESYQLSRIYEFSNFPPDVAPTEEEKQAAKEFKIRTYLHAKKSGWFDFKEGIKSGYHILDDLDPLHYMNREYVADGLELNPEKPEALMYYPTKKGIMLAGAMFLTNGVNSNAKQLGGNLTRWHVHKWSDNDFCWDYTLPKGIDVNCDGENEVISKFTPPMLHVWFVDHPEGPFSSDMCLPIDVLGEEGTVEEYLIKIGFNKPQLIEYQNKILQEQN
jgi:hypothetical protein